MRSFLLVSVCAAALLAFAASNAHAQRRDYMTEAEIELVRENQDIDLRIDILTKMIDRRLAVLGIAAGGAKISTKKAELWGEEPKGTRLDLLTDIKRILEKAIDDIDSIAERQPERMKEQRKGENIFNKSARSLATSANRWLPILKKEYDTAKDDKEQGVIIDSIEFCEQIIEAVAKLPAR